jgi:hypothetical protein
MPTATAPKAIQGAGVGQCCPPGTAAHQQWSSNRPVSKLTCCTVGQYQFFKNYSNTAFLRKAFAVSQKQ